MLKNIEPSRIVCDTVEVKVLALRIRVRGMRLRKCFENFYISEPIATAILVLSEQFSGKFCLIFVPNSDVLYQTQCI